ncbi:pancreatic lipase-related protein 2-like [Venturia canescens]|uniref:pancreatic lipase-related protein 2-like n=1 Tax=Venturia canescens TaxID=32260 RepID=UPI001C9C2286|nr:pancreatic lipase-related protein 2-like [Venturia canescens]
MGIAGRALYGLLKSVYGLDPVLPLFSFAPEGRRISKGGAQYFEIIHTDAGFLGIEEALGHIDFYVNVGQDQPDCEGNHACSQNRSIRTYLLPDPLIKSS